MTFLIISHVPHIYHNQQYFGYAPYVREMNIWLKYVSKVIILAPLENNSLSPIYLPYQHENIQFIPIKSFDITNFRSAWFSIFKLPKIIFQIFSACQKSNHINLRCPGNVGLLGCVAQIFFPKKQKTAKYAGNWDLKSKQPFTYKLQKYILNNTFLTRNMQVLVYGEWQKMSTNIKPFFTATYSENDKIEINSRDFFSSIKFIFVGTLVSGKRPLYAIELIRKLQEMGVKVHLNIYGDGNQKAYLENFILINNLGSQVSFHGNQNLETVTKAFQESHFVILASESEGWPKAIAEAMFWGCVPLATAVSCVPYMLDFGNRGLLLTLNINDDTKLINELLLDPKLYQQMSNNGSNWSRKYTLDYFEQEIKLLLQV
jgi:glycosyltransferase involved in cell wall biosynthesis